MSQPNGLQEMLNQGNGEQRGERLDCGRHLPGGHGLPQRDLTRLTAPRTQLLHKHKTCFGLGTEPGIQEAGDSSGQGPQELSMVLLDR